MTPSGAAAAGRGARGPASSFRVAFRFLPPARREGILTVYGFCRRADDAVDEAAGPQEARAALAAVRRELDDAFAGRADDPDVARLARVVEAFRLPREPFEELLEGVGWDIEGRRYESEEDLRQYCRHVASAVGLLCVRVFGCEEGAADAYAEELGVALQWTNILRDVGEDLERGRVYLPAGALRRHGLVESDLSRRDPDVLQRLDALIREQAAYARDRFAAAAAALPRRESRRLMAGRIMAAVYRVLLRKIERAGAAVLARKPRVAAPHRGLIALGVLLRDRLGSRA
ncbi:MAG: squalene/phytoene synthase family protein [Acidobacteriia bacterium]|nr:squalene/phytoene synthase family protein [Terriglobia bacterium]